MHGYHWKNVCSKLVKWDSNRRLPLLDLILSEMGKNHALSYDFYVCPLATELVEQDPSCSWGLVKKHLEREAPYWNSSVMTWLKGGLPNFDDKQRRSAIAGFPLDEVLEWIDEAAEKRSVMIAHAAPRSLDDAHGGRLTRELLSRYSHFDGVRNGISCIFHSGGWTGPRSAHLRMRREKFRAWLANDFDPSVIRWIEDEISDLDKSIEQSETEEERSRFD
jgi:hypothetical protein